MLSLTPKAKSKLAESTNKSVLYSHVLNDDDVGLLAFISTGPFTYLLIGGMGSPNQGVDCELSAARL